ncbi:type III-B CRISPR module RAMP protein Cmr4 [filamentous cyanobacterium LEGE 11480]|uniref:Type III-B CRISPR module RAMP protein Cmr4 n=1 Tax=Romeriopsis navalis LEGE 11480 TaxID=2777977 RepID=A0A928VU61_9CYAN|nr:RAMP superfamily CRISPR-associated protein [Romeriopsis navalis]MBE9033131.1 type III-B CRISPR module RAMP protein Cmr4 [Romeriopsis navalis LEGE 11480]
MFNQKAYGVIETLSPLHVGATAGEESGNLNLIFRDQFTQTGIIPGSSIRGRLRSEMRHQEGIDENLWYGREAQDRQSNVTTESLIKFEYASIVWIPVFCPGQPIVWVSCPRLLKRYKRITQSQADVPAPYTSSQALKKTIDIADREPTLFFNFGFLTIENSNEDLSAWFPSGQEEPAVVVDDTDIALIHDMALYRQSRVKLDPDEKKVDGKAFFNTEALPEGTIMVFPIAIKPSSNETSWQPFGNGNDNEDGNRAEIYLGGLESIGFGHCKLEVVQSNK